MQYIRKRVLDLGALINKGLTRLTDTTAADAAKAKVIEREFEQAQALWDAAIKAQPTRADVVQASETLNDIRKSADEAIARIDAWLRANPTGPEVK